MAVSAQCVNATLQGVDIGADVHQRSLHAVHLALLLDASVGEALYQQSLGLLVQPLDVAW